MTLQQSANPEASPGVPSGEIANMRPGLPGAVKLDSMQLNSTGQLCYARRSSARSGKRNAFTCQMRTPSRKQSAGVAMRELPLPATLDTATSDKQAKTPLPSQVSNGRPYKTREGPGNNDARRNSNGQASTSSRATSVAFQPPEQASKASTNGVPADGRQRKLDKNTYDATAAVNQAAPGFTAAARKASATTKQRSDSLLDAGQSMSSLVACDYMVHVPAFYDMQQSLLAIYLYHCFGPLAGMPAFSMDTDFRWSSDKYSNTQRSLDIWGFIIGLRTKLWLLDQKWSYVGRWTEANKTERLRSLASWTRYCTSCLPA